MIAAKEINYRTQAAYELANSVSCPRSAKEVYALGVSLQYCIRAKYVELEAVNQIGARTKCSGLAARQLDIKKEIEKLAGHKMNALLQYFYDHGGPIIEDPVSEQMVKELQPFSNRIMGIFLNSLDETAEKTLKGKMTIDQFEATINDTLFQMYGAFGKLFQVDEIQNAFNDLIDIRQSF